MKQYSYKPEDRFRMPDADWEWIFPLEAGYTHVRGHNLKYGLIKDSTLILEPKYAMMVEIVENTKPHYYLVRDDFDTPPYLVDAQGNTTLPTHTESTQFITYEPVTSGMSDGWGVDYWITKTYNEKLELISSEEPDWV